MLSVSSLSALTFSHNFSFNSVFSLSLSISFSMAAFSHQQYSPFLLNSPIFSSIKMSGSLEEGSNSINNNISSSSCFPYSSLCDHFQQIPPFDVEVHYVTEKQKTNADSSSIVVDLDGSNNSDHQVTQINKSIPSMDNKRKTRDGSCLSSAESKEPRVKKQRKCTQSMKEKEEMKKIKEEEKSKKQVLPPPTGYVHVRARRGEATDSHSLAERVRREKISERLKMLQTLVPGCDKVTSKALMLDEIINYVQSLQHQVEFLSMKLSTMSPMFYDFGGMELDSLMVKSEKPSSLVSSPLQSVQQPISIPSTSFADITTTFPTSNNYQLTNTFPTTSNYPLLDSPVSLLLQQGYKSNVFSQDLLWDGEEQKQRFSNQSDLTNLLCSPFQ